MLRLTCFFPIALMLTSFLELRRVSGATVDDGSRYLDLTYNVEEGMMVWPGDVPFKRRTTYNGTVFHGHWISMMSFTMSSHAGTHMDAPFHFRLDGWKLDHIPIERFVLPAVVVNVSGKTQNNADYRLTVQDLMEWKEANGRIPDKCMLVINYGWEKFETSSKYLGQTNDRDTTSLHFPGMSGEAARWIAEKRDVWAVGMDTYSTDYGQGSADGAMPAHWALFSRNIYTVEKLANVDRLPPKGATIYVSPLKITDGDGSPVRAIGMIKTTTSGGHHHPLSVGFVALAAVVCISSWL